MKNPFQLAVIEGFYGEPWSWEMRADTARFLARSGYTTYFYAPKADPFFRRRWREPFPAELFEDLKRLKEVCAEAKLDFGVGFSPYEIYVAFDDAAKENLKARLDVFNRLGVDSLAILFDDMKCAPGLAKTQAEIMHWIAERSTAKKLIFCPTYYSQDSILDRLFGERPENYLQDLGQSLDPGIGVFWTGQEICSKTYPIEHIHSVRVALSRKPVLWDNYPVNDGPKMCKFLHLKPFTGRPFALADELHSHVVNPMNQALLSRIPLLTLADVYREKENYDAMTSWRRAARACGSGAFAEILERDLALFSETGLDGIPQERKSALIPEYRALHEPIAEEVAAWLEGKTVVSRDVFLHQ